MLYVHTANFVENLLFSVIKHHASPKRR